MRSMSRVCETSRRTLRCNPAPFPRSVTPLKLRPHMACVSEIEPIDRRYRNAQKRKIGSGWDDLLIVRLYSFKFRRQAARRRIRHSARPFAQITPLRKILARSPSAINRIALTEDLSRTANTDLDFRAFVIKQDRNFWVGFDGFDLGCPDISVKTQGPALAIKLAQDHHARINIARHDTRAMEW